MRILKLSVTSEAVEQTVTTATSKIADRLKSIQAGARAKFIAGRRSVAQKLVQFANYLMSPNKFPRLLVSVANVIDPDEEKYQADIIIERYPR